jgi:hypothetical protein
MPEQIARPHFLSPYQKGMLPPAFRHWPALPASFERKLTRLLRSEQTLALYQAWKDGALELNPVKTRKVLLEVPVEHAGQTYFYCYPLDLDYLFSPQWREDNLSSPFGLFRWMIEMDTALRLGMVRGCEEKGVGRKSLNDCFSRFKKIEGEGCGYKHINTSLLATLLINTFLVHLRGAGLLYLVSGNPNQVVLSQATGNRNLYGLHTALSSLEAAPGQSWAKVLGFNLILSSAAGVAVLLKELEEDNWKKYQYNQNQVALAQKAGIRHLGGLFTVLSNFEASPGKKWTEVLKYSRINHPVARIKDFFIPFVRFVEESGLGFTVFFNAFKKRSPQECLESFYEIRESYYALETMLEEYREKRAAAQRGHLLEAFYTHLLRTLPFLPAEDSPLAVAARILEDIDHSDQFMENLSETLGVSISEARRLFLDEQLALNEG